MCSSFAPKVVTANDLIGGDVVYLSADDRWVHHHKDAEFLLDTAHAAKRLSFAEAQQTQVVGVYLAEAILSASGPAPVRFREAFRARGPSNHFHGKQAEQENVSV